MAFVFVFLKELFCEALWFEQDNVPEFHEVFGMFARGEPQTGDARLGCAVLLRGGSEHCVKNTAEVRELCSRSGTQW